MRRREFIQMLGGAAVAFPRAATAEIASNYRVGLLSAGPPLADNSPFGAPLVRGLAQQGYVLNGNLSIERRGAEGHVDRLPRLVAELVASKVDVIVAGGYPPALAAKNGTTLPVVAFFAGDPVGTGLVESLARPGGHVTGISDVSVEVTPKRLELLKQIAPNLRRVAVLWNADDLGMTLRYRASEAGAAVGRARAQRFRSGVRGNEPRYAGRDSHGRRPAHHSEPDAGIRVRGGPSGAGHL
jgi:putative ABC transport system substrate-binding protein